MTATSNEAETSSALTTEAANFREVLAAGRSTIFLRLFDFLVERANDERAPKEVEIALAVFGKDGTDETVQDSAVRVCVHRLRKRLEDFYADKPGPRLQILKGEYRVVLSEEPSPQPSERRLPSLRNAMQLGIRWWIAIAMVLAANALAWWWWFPDHQPFRQDKLAQTAFWAPVADQAHALVVAGDAFVLAETDNQKDIRRLILDPEIRTRSELGSYLMRNPDAFYKLYDFDLHYAPVGTAKAVWSVFPTVAMLGDGKSGQPRLVSSSRLTAEALESGNVVYVGSFSGLGILASPLFQVSGFKMDQNAVGLIDLSSGRLYEAPTSVTRDQEPYRDYGYVASLPGPSGKHVLIIAGVGDIGIISMSELVNDKAQLDELAKKIGRQSSFEALFEVRALGNVVLNKTLVVARPLRPASSSHR
jgi:hypothetical protein